MVAHLLLNEYCDRYLCFVRWDRLVKILSAIFLIVAHIIAPTFVYASDDIEKRISSLYDKVFEDPTNVTLNLELVRSQIQINDFKGASGTLERLLILAPNNYSALLLSAQVKFKLGNFQEAKLILTNLLGQTELDSTRRKRAEELLLKVNNATDGYSWYASVDLTTGISQNPENKPSKTSYSLLLPSSPIDVSGARQEFRGLALSGSFEKQFNSYDTRKLRLNLAHQRRDYNTYNKSDYEVYSASADLIVGDKSPMVNSFKMLRVRVRERGFMDQLGIETQSYIPTAFNRNLTGRAYIGRQIHLDHVNFADNSDKTGYILKLGVSGIGSVGQHPVRAMFDFDRKKAAKSQFAYHQSKVTLDTNLSFVGLNILGQASVARKRYDRADMIYSSKRRHDTLFNLALEAQLPIHPYFPQIKEGIKVSLRADVNRTKSNIDRFTSTKSEVVLKASYALKGQ